MKSWNWILLGWTALLAGCSGSEVAKTGESEATAVRAVDSRYLLEAEPSDAMPVGEARGSVKDDQQVTLVGTIGGSTEPFVKGLAAFTIVDPEVPYCEPDEGCPTPWDYCCTQIRVQENIATVKVVDEAGSPVADDARNLLGVKELSNVIVQGTAKRDENGNLTVVATKVFVRPSE